MTTQTSERLVGDSFRLGYRFQRYWDTSMAIAFFAAETGAGMFMVSWLFDFVPGMVLGLLLAGGVKPYFHLAHMGVPKKSWRAIIRPDRSWISRGTISIGVLVGCGALHVLNVGADLGVPALIGRVLALGAAAGALTVMCYQGFAMADSESLTLWASPLVPVTSFLYAATAGVLLTTLFGGNRFGPEALDMLARVAMLLLIADAIAIASLLSFVKRKSKGGAFSVELLMQGQYAPRFRNRVFLVGLAAPLALLLLAGAKVLVLLAASAAMLVGFFTFRSLMFKAAVFEPVLQDLAGSLGLPLPR